MGINRNIVECKDRSSHHMIIRKVVLIETLWNVKHFEHLRISSPSPVLIETLWNVKTKV